jgi:formylglycine-generating enzyme required for sulfatase activity
MRLKFRVVPIVLFAIGFVILMHVVGTAVGGQDSPVAGSERTDMKGSEHRKEISFDLGNGVKMEFVLIPAGSFVMGNDEGDAEERPAHKVTISKPFYMGKFKVTQQQWAAVMGKNPSHFQGAQNPVERVCWEDCQALLKKLNEKLAASDVTFSLPTEAEWEYACHAGSNSQYAFGDSDAMLADYGWFEGNADGRTHPVGEKKPNAWGLYDMQGNVWEWCADWYDGDYYKTSPAVDPSGPASGASRVLRGGSWGDPAPYCRASYRYCLPPWFCVYSYGVRLICR